MAGQLCRQSRCVCYAAPQQTFRSHNHIIYFFVSLFYNRTMSKSSRIRERNQVRAKALKGNALNLNNLQAEFLGKHASWNTKHNAYRSMAKLKGTRALQTLLGAAAELSFTAADPSARDDLLLEAVAWAKKYR